MKFTTATDARRKKLYFCRETRGKKYKTREGGIVCAEFIYFGQFLDNIHLSKTRDTTYISFWLLEHTSLTHTQAKREKRFLSIRKTDFLLKRYAEASGDLIAYEKDRKETHTFRQEIKGVEKNKSIKCVNRFRNAFFSRSINLSCLLTTKVNFKFFFVQFCLKN